VVVVCPILVQALEAVGPVGGGFSAEALALQLQGQALGQLLVVVDNEQVHEPLESG
jgi:hypothetical protein